MRMRIIYLVLLLLFSNTKLASCADDLDIKIESQKLFIDHAIHGRLGIRAVMSEEEIFYILDLERGNLKKGDKERLPIPLKISHRNTGPSSDGYQHLPQQIGYDYAGPQLMSPNGEFIVASCIKEKAFANTTETFVVVENESKKTLYKETLPDNASIRGIAWSLRLIFL